jgi:hypothetical protein
MSISIICSNCNATYNVPPTLAGKTVTCRRCNALLDVPGGPGGLRPRVAAGDTSYSRVVGRPNPIGLEILGIDVRPLNGEIGTRDILKLLWNCRHIVLFIALIILWTQYGGDRTSAQYAAPFFFFAGIILIIAGWIQMMTTSRNLAANISGNRKSSILPYIASSLVLMTTDFRASLPGLRTIFLGLLTLIVSLSLASKAGRVAYVLPIHLMPSFERQDPKRPTHAPLPSAVPGEGAPKTEPKPPPPPPPPPSEDDKPLPPPEDMPLPPPS